jgi:hypothetical protein
MIIYQLDFTSQPRGLYVRTELGKLSLDSPGEGQIHTTDPDIEGYATLATAAMQQDYLHVTLEQVKTRAIAVDTLKTVKHLILVGGYWEVAALLKKVHDSCFEFSFSGGERLWTKSFGMGEPL